MKSKIILSSLLAFSLAGNLFAQLPRPPGQDLNQRIQQMSSLYGSIGEYRVGRGDLIGIEVFDVEGFDQTLRVHSSGSIRVPLLGRIEVAGLSASSIEEHLSQLLEQGDFVKDPQVTVTVKEYLSQPLYVLGAVNSPGQYMMTRQMHLVDAIAMAGGLVLDRASDSVTIQRRTGTQPETMRVDLKKLLDGPDIDMRHLIQGGDVINVPVREIRSFYIVGEVNSAGAFDLPLDQELLVSQALAMAGGPQKTAKLKKGILVRRSNGARQELAVDFKAILKGEQADFTVLQDDIIFIPGSKAKTIGYGLLGVIPSTASQSVVRIR